MTLRDPDNFPKYRHGFDGTGRQAADEIDRLVMAPFLRKRTHTAQAIKKNGFLYVEKTTTAETAPFLWALIPRSGDNINNPRGYRLASARTMRNTYAQPASRVTVADLARNDYGLQTYVGDGYVLRLNTSYIPITDADANPDVDAWLGVAWPSLIKIGTTTPEVLSMSGGNVAGANVSFADVLLVDVARPTDSESTQPNIVAMGWDESVQGYSFGMFKRELAEIEPAPMVPLPIRFYYGNTANRTLSVSLLPSHPSGQEWRSARCWCVGPGKLLALAVPFGMVYPAAPSFLRSSDFGRTWVRTDATELVPYMLRVEDAVSAIDYRTNVDAGLLPWTFTASPIGNGRVAIVISGSRLLDAAIPFEGGHDTATDARWKFFVSDENGFNFINMPWPADDWFAFYQNRDMVLPPPVRWTPQTPHLSVAHQALQNSQMSAGPGSFFLTCTELTGPASTPVNSYDITQRLRVLHTEDYGFTWNISPEVPQAWVSPHSNYQLATFAVASPYRDEQRRGEVYMAATHTGGPMRVVRTSAAFRAFALVAETFDSELLSDMSDFHFFDAYFGTVFDPPVSHGIRPLYVGATRGTAHPPRVNAAYPGEYDKP